MAAAARAAPRRWRTVVLVLLGIAAAAARASWRAGPPAALRGLDAGAFAAPFAGARPALGLRQTRDAGRAGASPIVRHIQCPNLFGLIIPVEKKISKREPPYINRELLNAVTRMNKEGVMETIQVKDRKSVIIPAMIGHTLGVHDGKDFKPLTVTDNMVGWKISDFVWCIHFGGHPKPVKATKYTRKRN